MSEPWEQYLRPSELQPSAVKKSGMDQYLDQLDRADAAVIKRLPPPDHVGRSNEMARTFKLPPTIADSALPDLEKQHAINRAQEVAKQYPAVGRWASDPRNAAVAADDYESLELLGKGFYGLKNIGSSLKSGLLTGTAGLWGAITGLAENMDALTPSGGQAARDMGIRSLPAIIADFSRERQKEGQGMAQAARPQVDSWVARNLLKGIESVPMAGVSIATSMASSPAAGVSVFAGSTGGNEYAKAREAGLSPARAGIYGAGQAAIEYVTEKIPVSRLVGDIAAKSPLMKTLFRQLATEIPGEQVATLLQDFNEWATLNPEKTFRQFVDERPAAAAETLVATIGGAGFTTSLSVAAERTARAGVKVIDRVARSRAAVEQAAALDGVMDAAAKSKTAGRDNVAFADLLREMADESGAENVYVPAEAINAYMQSDGYDGSFDEAMADVMAEISDKFAEQDAQTKKDMEPRDKLMQSVADKLMNAGFTPATARTQAELLTQRAGTRSARMGQDLTGNEYNDLVIQQVLPEGLAQAQKADALDMTIGVMRTGKTGGSNRGPSLVDFIRSKGGIEDRGGDLKSMGIGPIKGVSRKGQLKLLRDYNPDQASMLGADGQQNSNSPDELAMRAWEAGYFPEFTERPSVNDLLEALAESVAGRDRFAQAADAQTEGLRKAAEELRAVLENRGIDPDKASAKEIRSAVDAYVSEQAQGVGYDQVDVNSEAFKKWFGASKVVDAQGRPLVVYHGTNADIDTFDKEKVGARWDVSIGFHFSDRTDEASLYAGSELGSGDGSVIPAYLKIENPLVIETSGQAWRYADDNRFEIIKEIVQSRRKAELDDPKKRQAEDDALLADLLGSFEENPFSEAEFAPTVHKRSEYKPLSAYDGIIIKGSDGANFIVFEPTQIKSVNNRGAFDPSDPRILYQDAKGRIVFPATGYGTGKTVIELFQSRDQSTFLHETGHLWLEELRFDASDPNAPEQLKNDWQAVQDWFKANSHPLNEDGAIPVDAHEMWARGVERYLMEGKAPSPALRSLFQTFKSWLVQVYRTVAKLNAPITDDIRAVMDRLIATDEEIVQAREEQHLEAAFTEKPATMTEGEWTDYQSITTEAKATAQDTLLAKVMSQVKRRVTKEYQDRKAAIRAEVTEEIDARPEFRAMRQLRATPVDAQWLKDGYGEDAPALFPKSVPPLYKDGGANADDIAELTGFKSGDEMVRLLFGVEAQRLQLREGGDKRSVREVMIAQETETRLTEQYGDPFTDGSIEEEALAAVHNEKQGEVLAAELRVLSRASGDRPTPYRIAKAWAARTVREGIVRDVVSRSAIERYRRAAQKAGKASVDAILAGDSVGAFRQKQAQMLNNALVSEAQKVADEVETAQARLEKIATKKTIKSVDQDYLERAQALMEQVELRPRSQKSIERQAQFEAWANEQQANGADIVVPASFAASLGTTHWSRLPVEQFLGLDAAVAQIIHLGRFKQTLLDNKEARDFDEVRSEALGQMGGMGKRPPSDLMEPSRWDGIRERIAGADAALLKMETVFDWLDQGRSDGVFNRIVFQPIAEAQHNEQAMLREYVLKVQELTKALPKQTVKRWRDKFTDPRLMNSKTGNPWVLSRDQLISIALNMGNASNRAKLAGGYGWNEQAAMDVLNENLTEAEWQYVQSIWDTIESLWPQIEAMEKRVNGIAPEKIDAEPIVTSAGALRGGYYPVVYDPRQSIDAELQGQKSGDSLFENNYTRAATSRGFTKERTNVERPIHLSLSVIERHLSEVIHDLTHREAIMQADKFLTDRRIVAAVDETLGPEVRRQFRPWLQHIANEWAYDRDGGAAAEKFLRAMRRNATFVGMAFRASTVFMQAAGFSDSTGVIGSKAMTHGLQVFGRNPKQAINFVLERSGEVRARMDTLDRDIREAARRHAGEKQILSAAQRFGYMGIGFMDRLVVVPTWIGAYDKALAAGKDEQAAIYEADKAVRVSQGSGAAKDLASVQRGRGTAGEAMKLMTMFYSYASGYYQRLRTLGRDVRKANASDIPNLVARSFFLVIAPALLAELLAGRGPDEDDEEGWAEWAFQKVALSVFNPIPLLRDVLPPAVAAAQDKPTFGYSFTPVAKMGDTFVNLARDAGNVIEGEETKRATRDFLESVGYVTGLVPGQIATSAQFLVDVAYGEQDPETFGDWYEGLSKGKVSE